jgi:plasmid stabilization system protein ParE
MAYRLLITPIAQQNIEQAFNYYLEEAGDSIADMFYDDLQFAYNSLEINPFYQVRVKRYRALPLRKFPYLLFFEIVEESNLVKILSLFHTSQDPNKWP